MASAARLSGKTRLMSGCRRQHGSGRPPARAGRGKIVPMLDHVSIQCADVTASACLGGVEDPGVRGVARQAGVQPHGVGRQRLFHVDHRRQGFVPHLDGREGIDRARPVPGYHHGNRFADVAHHIDRQRRMRRRR